MLVCLFCQNLTLVEPIVSEFDTAPMPITLMFEDFNINADYPAYLLWGIHSSKDPPICRCSVVYDMTHMFP